MRELDHRMDPQEMAHQQARLDRVDTLVKDVAPEGQKPLIFAWLEQSRIEVYTRPASSSAENGSVHRENGAPKPVLEETYTDFTVVLFTRDTQ